MNICSVFERSCTYSTCVYSKDDVKSTDWLVAPLDWYAIPLFSYALRLNNT